MRTLSLLVLTILTAAAAHGAIRTVDCADCRDPDANWRDYGNYAYNQVFGPDADLNPSQGSKMTVVNPNDRWAVVDLDFVLNDSGFTAMLGFLSVEIPSVPESVQISVYTDTGNVFTAYAVPNGRALLVGDPPRETRSGSGSGGSRSSTGGGSSGGYTTVPSTFRYRFGDGSSGTVSICNPDVRGDCRGG